MMSDEKFQAALDLIVGDADFSGRMPVLRAGFTLEPSPARLDALALVVQEAGNSRDDVARLQKRVEELEAEARKTTKNHKWAYARAGELLQRAERAETEAAEQRKRAEIAEAGWIAQMRGCAAAIEKARQEEREVLMERVVETLQTCFPLPASKWTPGSLVHATAALRALKGA